MALHDHPQRVPNHHHVESRAVQLTRETVVIRGQASDLVTRLLHPANGFNSDCGHYLVASGLK